MSIHILYHITDASAGLYEDDGPNVVSQPWPRYVNESRIFNWSCNAVGEAELDYSWKRTSLVGGFQIFISYLEIIHHSLYFLYGVMHILDSISRCLLRCEAYQDY